MREPYPVINDCPHPKKGFAMTLLEGKGAYQNYNAHFIPVASINPQNPRCMEYYPCYQDQKPAWNEIVVFQKAQTLTRFWVELTLDTPSPLLKQPYSFSAAYAASQNGDLEQLKTWIQEAPKRLQDKGPKGETLLHAAALGDQQTTLRWLSQQDPSLLKSLLADTPFILKLAALPVPQTLNFLLEKGLDPQRANSFKQTLLHIAAQAGQGESVKLLLDKGVLIDSQDNSKSIPLFLAVIQGHRSTVKLLLERQAKTDLRSIEGETILHAAAFYGYTLVLQDLLNHLPCKALISAEDEDGKTPLHKAVWLDPKPDIVTLLLDHGADPNALNKYQYTPLHWAAKHGHLQSASILIARKADPQLLNANGDLAVDLALRHGQDEFVHFFLGTTQRLVISSTMTTTTSTQIPPPKDILKYYQDRLMEAHQARLVEEQILYLKKISDYNLQNHNYIPAAMILNAALALLKTHKQNPLFEKYLLNQMERIPALYLDSQNIKIPPTKKSQIQTYRDWLAYSRERCQNAFANQEPIQEILYDLTQETKKIFKLLINQALELLGAPPVAWTCIAMGSMARDEMCPYSDLEFAFIIAEETPQALGYFRRLARILEILVINLGETKCEIFGSLAPSPTPNGLCMDTGGNIPIGGAFELIATPTRLAQLQTAHQIDENIILSNIMNFFCIVTGHSKLAERYLAAKNNILEQKENKQKNSHRLAFRLIAGHLQEFSPDLTQEKEELKTFGIKKELYRPFQEILSSLALLFNLKSGNTLERIDELISLKVFSPEGGAHLKKAISQALALRLEAHLFYKNEIEFLHQIEEPQDPNKFYLNPARFQILQEIYKVLIPFCKATEEFYRTQNKKVYSHRRFYDKDLLAEAHDLKNKGFLVQEAKRTLQQAIALDPNNVQAQLLLGRIEGDPMLSGNPLKELERAEKALQIARQKYGNKHPDVAMSLNSIGDAFANLGESTAFNYYKQALEITKSLDGMQDDSMAESLYKIVCALGDLEKPVVALDYHQQILEICKPLYGYPQVAIHLSYMGAALIKLEKPAEALEYYTLSLKMLKFLYGDHHPDVGKCLNNMGTLFSDLGKSAEAIDHYKQALEVRKALYGQGNASVAVTLSNIGSILRKTQKPAEALEYYEESLLIRKLLLLPFTNCSAEALEDFATHLEILLVSFTNYSAETLEDYAKHLELREAFCSAANCSNDIGLTLSDLGNSTEALQSHLACLYIRSKLYKDAHPDLATSLYNVGSANYSLKQMTKALDYFLKALACYKIVYGEKQHLDIVQCLVSIGDVFYSQGKPVEALDHYKQAMEAQKSSLWGYPS